MPLADKFSFSYLLRLFLTLASLVRPVFILGFTCLFFFFLIFICG